MWPSISVKIRYHCSRFIFGTTKNHHMKMQEKFISCDSWYSSPTTKPIVQDTTAIILGEFKIIFNFYEFQSTIYVCIFTFF